MDNYFEDAQSVTRKWVYDREAPRPRDRIKVKFNSEHALPVKMKALDELLYPKPGAQVVIHRLLDWMDRIDLATQTGDPRPPFKTTDGKDIFPDSDSPWWLTDLSRRAVADQEQDAGDEDCPVSEIEEEGQQAVVSDDDPVSSEAEATTYTPSLGKRG